MNLKQSYEKLRSNKGLYQFILRTIIFAVIVGGFYLLLSLWIRHMDFFVTYLSIDTSFYFSWFTGLRKTDFLNAAAFAVIAFLIWKRDAIKKLKPNKRSTKQTIIYSILAVLFLVSHYLLKYWIGQNQDYANQFIVLFTVLKQLLTFLFVVATAFAVYTEEFLLSFIKKHWKTILIFLGLGVAYFFLIQLFQLIWYQLSYFVATTIRGMLSLTFDNVVFSAGSQTRGPVLGAGGFNVGISNECSGVDSLLLFLSLYVLLLALDWDRFNLKRMFILLIPGIIGTVAYNILRIYVLMLVGIFIDPELAVGVFHTNLGWVLFLVFFAIFWHFGSKWVYKKQKVKK